MLANSDSKSLSVLVIGEPGGSCDLVLNELRNAGIKPSHECCNSLTAVGAALVAWSWDAIVAIDELADLTAQDVLSFVRVAAQNVPVIIVSGAIGKDEAIALIKGGASELVFKSDLARLVPALSAALREAEMRRQEQEAMRALSKRERFLREITSAMGDGLLVVDSEWRLVFMNPEAERVLGWTAKELRGQHMHSALHYLKPDGSPFPASECPSCMPVSAHGRREVEDDYYLHKDGTFVPVSYTITYTVSLNGERRYVIVFRDRREQKRAEQELRESRRQLRELSAYLQQVREDERTAIARELHDELGQVLSGLRMDAEWLQRHRSNDLGICAKTEAMMALIDSGLKTVRRISSELRPPVLDELGLEAAIEWLVEGHRERTGNRCHMYLQVDDTHLREQVATAVFRLVQESLTNVGRYAQAETVEVTVTSDSGHIEVKVCDDGIGFDVDAPRPHSFGVLGMRERVIALKGRFSVDSAPGQGTCVHALIPLSQP